MIREYEKMIPGRVSNYKKIKHTFLETAWAKETAAKNTKKKSNKYTNNDHWNPSI